MTGFASVYAPIWKNVTRWSLMGVVLSEMTANAYAYLVTFISGAHAFALLAIGSLMLRPRLARPHGTPRPSNAPPSRVHLLRATSGARCARSSSSAWRPVRLGWGPWRSRLRS